MVIGCRAVDGIRKVLNKTGVTDTGRIGFVDVVAYAKRAEGALTIERVPRQLKAVKVASQETNERGEGESACVHPRDGGLLAIGLFKLGKAIFFFCLGLGAIHLLHKDLADEVVRLATALKFDPESRFVAVMLDKVDLIDHHRLREISMATLAYSALALTEGIGLLMEKVWAEYLTLILTISFLPWEVFELVRRPSWFRLGLLVINLLVLGYLLWLLQRKKLLLATTSSIEDSPVTGASVSH